MKSYINSIGTATPKHRYSQKSIAHFMASMSDMNADESRKLEVLYRASGINYRNSVLDDFDRNTGEMRFLGNNGQDHPGITERMRVFRNEALPLSVKALNRCMEGYVSSSFTHLITVSCTGMYAPGLDIELVEELGLPSHIKRTGIHFMGCYAAFNALKVADSICKSEAGALVLMVCVELCTIHFQNRKNEDTLLSNALFSDGAAAAVISSTAKPGSLELQKFFSDIEPAGKPDMTWEIADFGFEIHLSGYVPDLIRKGIDSLAHTLLENLDLGLEDIDHFAIHPGGKKILKVVEESLAIPPEKSVEAHEVLREHGNMSSPTIMFVLEKILKNKSGGSENILAFAFGPGLTLESMLLKTVD